MFAKAKTAVKRLLGLLLPERQFLVLRHVLTFHRFPNLVRPERFTEHMLQIMLNRSDERLRRIFADRLAVRTYVADKIGESYLPKLLLVTENPADIDFGQLPDSFVMKANHGSGMVVIVKDKSGANEKSLRRVAARWMATDFYPFGKEYVYKDLPRRIQFEELLVHDTHFVPLDYKVFVFHGVSTLVQVDLSRFSGHRRVLMTPDWKRIDVKYTYPLPETDPARPQHLEQMLTLASELSSNLPFIRVDFYDLGDRVVVGELTNFPDSGNAQFDPISYDVELGRMISAEPQSIKERLTAA